MYICPFCGSGTGKNSTGALKLYESTNTWHCHKCDMTGDVLDLIQHQEGVDYNAARAIASDRLGLIPETATSSGSFGQYADKERTQSEQEQTPAEDYSAYYAECAERLKNSKEAIFYLSARGISLATATALRIGFDPAADPAKNGHGTPRLILATTKNHYVGRSIDAAIPKEYAKMNVKGGTPGVFNAPLLYRQGTSVIFITEGAFDAMSICEVGKQAIALNSAGNGKALIRLLEERPADKNTKFIISFDNDADPNTAAKVSAQADELKNRLRSMGYDCITCNIAGDHKDANEALQADRAAFAEAVDMAERKIDKDALSDFLETIQTEAYKPYKTDLSFFDRLLDGGVIPQSLLILMAAPGTGKTTLCQQIAEAMAAHQKPVIYLNLEMSREQMLAKSISGRLAKSGKLKVKAIDILQGYRWREEEKGAILEAIADYRKRIFPFIQYNPANVGSDLDMILSYLTNEGEKAKAQGKPAPVVIVDYLHLITAKGAADNQELMKRIVTGLKEYAINYHSFVIGISATNRTANSSGKTTLESGRDSSSIEYTGDYVLSLNYSDLDSGKKDPTNPRDIAELQAKEYRNMIIRVLKGRFVMPGRTANVYFNAAHNLFYGDHDFLPVDAKITPFDDAASRSTRTRI